MFGSHYHQNPLNGPNWAVYITSDDLYPLIVNNSWNDSDAFEKIKYILEYRKGHSDIVNKGFSNNITPLQAAIEKGNIAVVRLLLEHGAALPSDALALAARSKVDATIQNQLIRLLIELGAGKNPEMNARALAEYFENRKESISVDNISIFINTMDILSDLPITWIYCYPSGESILQKLFFENPILIPMMLEKGAKTEQILMGPFINAVLERGDSLSEMQEKYLQLANMIHSDIRRKTLLGELCEKGITPRMRTEAAIEMKKKNLKQASPAKEEKQANIATPSNFSSSKSTMFSSSTTTTGTVSSTNNASASLTQPLPESEALALFEKKLFTHKCFKKSTKPGVLYEADSYSLIPDADLIKLGLKPGQWVRDKKGMDNFVYIKEISLDIKNNNSRQTRSLA